MRKQESEGKAMIERNTMQIRVAKEKIPTYVRTILETSSCPGFLPISFCEGAEDFEYTVDRSGFQKMLYAFDRPGPDLIFLIGRLMMTVAENAYRLIMPEHYEISEETVFLSPQGIVRLAYIPAEGGERPGGRIQSLAGRTVRVIGDFMEQMAQRAQKTDREMAEEIEHLREAMEKNEMTCQEMMSRLIRARVSDLRREEDLCRRAVAFSRSIE